MRCWCRARARERPERPEPLMATLMGDAMLIFEILLHNDFVKPKARKMSKFKLNQCLYY
jgi:hypothetical protein